MTKKLIKPLYFIFLDPAPNHTGIAIFEDGAIIYQDTVKYKRAKEELCLQKLSWYRKFRRLLEIAINTLITIEDYLKDRSHYCIIALEQPLFCSPKNIITTLLQVAFTTILWCVLAIVYKYKPYLIGNQKGKMRVGCKGNAKKPDVIKAVRELGYKLDKDKVSNEDECDAIAGCLELMATYKELE